MSAALYPEANHRGTILNPQSGYWPSAIKNPICAYWWSQIKANNP